MAARNLGIIDLDVWVSGRPGNDFVGIVVVETVVQPARSARRSKLWKRMNPCGRRGPHVAGSFPAAGARCEVRRRQGNRCRFRLPWLSYNSRHRLAGHVLQFSHPESEVRIAPSLRAHVRCLCSRVVLCVLQPRCCASGRDHQERREPAHARRSPLRARIYSLSSGLRVSSASDAQEMQR